MKQYPLFTSTAPPNTPRKFIASYRITLVRDRPLPFESCRINNSREAQPIIRKLIESQGQPDREQFCLILLNAKNESVGVNIVSTGTVTSAQVCPREVLKPAILANSCALILAHNHPSGDLEPSSDDLALTEKIIRAAALMGITIHEHIIVSLFDDRYYSMADHGTIKRFYDQIN